MIIIIKPMKSAALTSNGKTYYEFLGVEKASEVGDIAKAYREMAKVLHPDKNNADDA